MAVTITHPFVSGIADDPHAAAAGEVLPSHWNATHVVSGLSDFVSGAPYDMPTPLGPSGGNLTFYVSTTGSDSNNGLSPAQAVATPQRAINLAVQYNYGAGDFTWTVNIANGDYTGLPFSTGLRGGSIIVTLNGTESEVPTVNGGGSSTCIIGEVVMPLTQGNNFLQIGNFTAKSGSSIATIWQLGNNSIIVGADITVATSRVDGHVDQIFYSTGPRGAVLINNVNVTVDSSITNTQALATAVQGSVEFTSPNLIFPGSAISASQGIFVVGTSGFLSFNSVSIVNGSNFGSGTSTAFVDLHAEMSFDSSLTLGTGIIFSTDNSSVINKGGSVACFTGIPTVHRPPATTEIYPITWGVFHDSSANDVIGIYYNDGGVIRCTQIGHKVLNQTSATYTLQLRDQEGILEMNNAGANTLTVPTNASVNFPVGATVSVVQVGAGATTIAAAGGVTLHNAGALTGQYASAIIYQRATDEWVQLNGAF